MHSDIIFPQWLHKGDSVAVIAPAGVPNPATLRAGLEVLEQWGLKVVTGESLFNVSGTFAGSDAARAEDFNAALSNERLKAIFMARGGYGSTRIIDRIDFHLQSKHAKWIVGFSDITALLIHQLATTGVAGIHGAMVAQYAKVETASSVEYLRRLLFGAPVDGIEANPHELNVTGTATGTLIGGNLCLLCHLLGSSSDVDYNGKILFLEDVGEQLYRIDRMMIQLKRAGKLAHLKGLVIGQFTENTEEDLKKYGHSAQEIIHLHTREYSYPVAFNFPIGHVDDNMPVVVGATAELEVKERGNARLRYIKMSDSRQAHYTAK